jgi:hypothetical protein
VLPYKGPILCHADFGPKTGFMRSLVVVFPHYAATDMAQYLKFVLIIGFKEHIS